MNATGMNQAFQEYEDRLKAMREFANDLEDKLGEASKEIVILKTACRATLARLENPLLDTMLFDDVKKLLRIALE